MTKQYDIIHLPDGFMYGIDEKLPNEGEVALWFKEKIWKTFQKTKNGFYIQSGTSQFRPIKEFQTIVFTNNPSLGLPLLPDIIDIGVEALLKGQKVYPMGDVNNELALGGYIRGYKAASAKKYTEEDMYNVAKLCALASGNANNYSETMTEQRVKSFIQSLSPKPIAVEVEMEDDTSNLCDCYYTKFCKSTHLEKGIKCRDEEHLKLKLINNKVVVKQWIYNGK